MKIKFDKSGKLFSIWWIFMMIIVTVGIVISTSFFYSSYADIRDLEAEALSIKLSNCILNNIVINDKLLINCGIEPSFFEPNSEYFVKVSFEDIEYKFGNNAFETDCKISNSLIAKNYPKCREKSLKIKGKDINILTGSNNFGKRNDLI